MERSAALYDDLLDQKACAVVALMDTISFDVVGHDYWSLMEATFNEQYFEQAFAASSEYEVDHRGFFLARGKKL